MLFNEEIDARYASQVGGDDNAKNVNLLFAIRHFIFII